MRRSWPLSLLFLPLLAGCAMPRDPEGTSGRISATRELRVGVTDNPPWVTEREGEPGGIEPQLVRQFAASLPARVRWARGSETVLAEALKRHKLDLVVGGFDEKTKWVSMAGISQPFLETPDRKKHVILAAPGENRFILTLDRFLSERMRAARGRP